MKYSSDDKIIFHWSSIGDLKQMDASLSYGWFEFCFDHLSISFFKERGCMVFLTITTLIDFLSTQKKNDRFSWVGEGNGRQYYFIKEGENIILQDKSNLLKVSFSKFRDIVLESSMALRDSMVTANPSIKTEGAFSDFDDCLRSLDF